MLRHHKRVLLTPGVFGAELTELVDDDALLVMDMGRTMSKPLCEENALKKIDMGGKTQISDKCGGGKPDIHTEN